MKRFVVLCALLVAACGDNHETAPDASPQTPDAAEPQPAALVVSGDFNMTGIMSKLDMKTLAVTENVAPSGAVAGDPVVRHIGNRVYVVNRLGANNVTLLDARTLAFIDQYSTGENTNPQDVAVVGNSLFVPALASTGMIEIDVVTGETHEIDLGGDLGDPDGNPDCVSAYAIDNKVYVACGLLDEFYTPRGPAKVAIYNTTSGAVSVVTLPFANPQNFIVRAPVGSVLGGDLLVQLVPSFTSYSTGCVARVSTGASPTATCATGLTNMDLGGFQTHLDVAADGSMLWIAVGTLDGSFMNPTGQLRGFDLTSGTLAAASLSPPAQLITDLAACPDGSVVAVDRTMNASGLRVYAADGTERTTAALGFGLPPSFGNNVVCYDLSAP